MNTTDTYITSLLLGLAVAIIHATFQLGISVLTLLSGHSLGAKKAHSRLLRLNISYILGTFTVIFFVLLSFVVLNVSTVDPLLLWSISGIVASLTGFFVLLAYYRKGKGTLLWIPRSIAEYLSRRAKKTRNSVESFALGMMTTIAELPFAFASLFIASLEINSLPEVWHVSSIIIYGFIVSLPLIVITVMLGSGHRLSTLQRWRESNKIFLQYSAGIGLIVTSLYITVFYVMREMPR